MHNVVAAAATVGLVGKEGDIIRKTIIGFLYYAFITGYIDYMIVWNAETGTVNLGSVMLLPFLLSLAAFVFRKLRRDKSNTASKRRVD